MAKINFNIKLQRHLLKQSCFYLIDTVSRRRRKQDVRTGDKGSENISTKKKEKRKKTKQQRQTHDDKKTTHTRVTLAMEKNDQEKKGKNPKPTATTDSVFALKKKGTNTQTSKQQTNK